MDNHHLILARGNNEKIIIAIDTTALALPPDIVDDSGIFLTIGTHDIRSNQVKLDFYAPAWIKIWREEVYQRF
ncbi:MAG: carbon storage regulator [Gammaproteobacteria bacterium]